jgi:hypothetical protein
MNTELKNKILELKMKLKRGDMARIVELTARYGIQKYDVYNILNGKSLVDHQKLIIIMKEVKKCVIENQKYLEEFETHMNEL